ncbi:solute carrier family 38 (sodium-coupled neutral amino acid transporter), member 11 [Kwoniella heveanensis CBS 569]|uniref:Solute carrier family 38 (Sodium-coupled neutral amino acid transporter), member 11 n=1 Tax=Kwoniella heveanensis BCC8398 TaxID=1296120 RepID=A0A1B9GQY1_9TREE|nr:solute carrier family 38 (sodium-coupled neutral amino acid transporter), member 11 [Kwoniella heveanensis BCC8398]OCF42059.1 solute carrier family 38 (sodium-coupled neutral amino acid transporter), member 11 [Kwoniella heveanensis CBS 569]
MSRDRTPEAYAFLPEGHKSSSSINLYPYPPHSNASSGPSSRRGSRRGSKEQLSDTFVNGAEDVELGERGNVLFKAPDDEFDHSHEHDDQSATAPLLSSGNDRGNGISEEEHELLLAEGPNSATRGTLMDAVTNMANSIIGAGIIGLPYAVAQAGFVTGIFLLIAIAIMSDWTIRLVILTSKLSGRDSYTETVHHCFGNAGAAAVAFFQFSFAFGGTAAFHVIIGDTIPRVISYIFPSLVEHAVLRLLVDRRVVILLCTLFVSFPLSLHRDMVKLSKSSSFALVSMGIIVFSVLFRSVAVDPSLRGSSLETFSLIRPGVFQAIGVISFAYACHHNTNYIYKSIQMPTLDRFNTVTHISTGVSLVACLLVAVTGYVVFTDKTQGNILNNFSSDDWLINIARFCFGANMSTTIPLEVYVCREVVEEYFFKSRPFNQQRHVIITSLTIFSTMAIALITCDLGVVLELSGGLSASALAFIFPAGAYYVLSSGHWYSPRTRLPALLVASFGAVVLVLSCTHSIAEALTGEGNKKVCA